MGQTLQRSLLAIGMMSAFALGKPAVAQDAGLADLSLEELAEVRVTSVSRQSERVADAPASVYVITRESIRTSGVTSLPEALRLAPNLEVARIDPVQYAISARGFNNAVGNKLLVMIDGRIVYTPLFSGVFWDQQDVLLEDIDRIEVISGPGATLWGANAVNGVINIITRPAGETQGTFVSAGAGNLENNVAVRYGGGLGGSGHFRAYAKTSSLANTQTAGGADLLNAWDRTQVGFRADWDQGNDRFTLQADAYEGESEDRGSALGFAFGSIEVGGHNVLGRWTRHLADAGELRVQSYFDHTEREDVLFFRPDADIFDVEVTHSKTHGKHDVLVGGGYRRSSDEINTGFVTTFIPRSADLEWANLFMQDRIALNEHLEATVGLKLERNDYTGTESLPSARLAWKPSEQRLLWTAVSRAVRAPARFDKDVFFPGTPPFLVIGGPNFVSEVANVIDVGYRAEPTERLSYSFTVFHHDWDKLRSGTSVPVQLENRIEGDAQGVEAWATWRFSRTWQLGAGVNTLDLDLRLEPGSTDPVGVHNETLANDPDYQWFLRATANLPRGIDLDLRARHVEDLQNPAVPEYDAVDASLTWSMRKRLALVVTVQNLFDGSHPEYGPAATRSELERGVYVEVRRSGQ
ncbi:MAG TPA: TonB-dependent receptor [Gammaproteobacteria bacterium]|nr:TonB-dependent receptor [Gammaproteobacteria bacterium]